MFPEQRLKEIFEECKGKYEEMQPIMMKEFGWTEEQCYIATEFLFRPENYN